MAKIDTVGGSDNQELDVALMLKASVPIVPCCLGLQCGRASY